MTDSPSVAIPQRIARTLLLLIATAYGTYQADQRHDAFLLGRHALLTNQNPQDLRYLYPDPQLPQQKRRILQQYNLTIFRP